MKSVFIVLLLAFSLVAMPAVAADLVSAPVQEFRLDETEAKFITGEEVAVAIDGENVAALSVDSYPAGFPLDIVERIAHADILKTAAGFTSFYPSRQKGVQAAPAPA